MIASWDLRGSYRGAVQCVERRGKWTPFAGVQSGWLPRRMRRECVDEPGEVGMRGGAGGGQGQHARGECIAVLPDLGDGLADVVGAAGIGEHCGDIKDEADLLIAHAAVSVMPSRRSHSARFSGVWRAVAASSLALARSRPSGVTFRPRDSASAIASWRRRC